MINYKKPLEIVEQYVAKHRSFLDEGYQKNYFVVSGPRNPRTGGVLLSQLDDREKLENILKQDPYYINDIAEYEFIEFTPVKYHSNFATFVE